MLINDGDVSYVNSTFLYFYLELRKNNNEKKTSIVTVYWPWRAAYQSPENVLSIFENLCFMTCKINFAHFEIRFNWMHARTFFLFQLACTPSVLLFYWLNACTIAEHISLIYPIQRIQFFFVTYTNTHKLGVCGNLLWSMKMENTCH